MAWLEAHQSLSGHPKTRKAALRLGIPKVQLIGHLFCLWWWVIDYAPDGDITCFDAEDIALAAEWDGEPEAFMVALIECRFGDGAGFLERAEDGRLLIHDWWEYAGKLIARRQADAARKRGERQADAPKDEPAASPVEVPPPPSINRNGVPRTSRGHPADIRTVTVRTQQTDIQDQQDLHNSTGPTDRTLAPDADAPDAPDAADAPLSADADAATDAATTGIVLLQPVTKRARSPDPIWDALTALFGTPLLEGERSLLNGVAKRFRDGAAKEGITPAHIASLIEEAGGNWANVMGKATCTPTALLKHFTLLLAGPQRDGRSDGIVRAHTQKVTEYASVPHPVSTADVRRQGRLPRAN